MIKVFAILGRAGCGKGTQAKLLSEKFGLTYIIGSGDLLRQRAETPDFTGRKIDETMKQGDLSPTSLIFMLWANQLEEIKKKEVEFKGIIFDGSPRKLVEANLLEESLTWYEWNNNFKAILVDISRQTAFDRLTKRRQCAKCGQLIPYIGEYKDLTVCDKCGGELAVRQDDTPEAINKRLDLFEQEVLPVVDFYEKKGLLIKINGEQSIEDVHREIMEKIS